MSYALSLIVFGIFFTKYSLKILVYSWTVEPQQSFVEAGCKILVRNRKIEPHKQFA